MLAACAGGPVSTSVEPQAGSGDAAWREPGGDDANARHSPLAQITPDNVARLQPAWQFATGAPRGQEGAPLVVGDVMFLHTPFPNTVTALSLADQRVLWTYQPRQDRRVVPLMCCDVVIRGLEIGRAHV